MMHRSSCLSILKSTPRTYNPSCPCFIGMQRRVLLSYHSIARSLYCGLTSLTQVVTHARTLKKEVRNLFLSVMALICLLLLCPASSAEAERSFSSLRHLKTWLRSTMTQERLNSVAVCHIHQDLLHRIDMDAIMCDFVSHSEIRKNIFGNNRP